MEGPEATLGRLAVETGGFLSEHSNDLAAGFLRIREDMAGHYVLTYSPTDASHDGTYRRIQVRAGGRGLRVRARSGYRALPPAGGGALLEHEAPALAALEATPVPNDFPHVLRALRFPAGAGRTRLAILVEAASHDFEYVMRDDRSRFAAGCVVIVRVRDLHGQVVTRGSERYDLAGAAQDIEQSRNGRLLFLRTPTLAPGAYTVESVVHDVHGRRNSVRLSSLDIEPGGLHVSDLFQVSHAEQSSNDGSTGHPLVFGSLLVYPRMTGAVSRSSRGELVFGLTMDVGDLDVGAEVEVWHDGRQAGTVSLPLDLPDADGLVRQLIRLPMDAFDPGAYEMRVRIRTDGREMVRSTRVVISP